MGGEINRCVRTVGMVARIVSSCMIVGVLQVNEDTVTVVVDYDRDS